MNIIQNITSIEEIKQNNGFDTILSIYCFERLKKSNLSKPSKPKLCNYHTPYDVLRYAEELQEYEDIIVPNYELEKSKNIQYNNLINDRIVQLIKDDSGYSDLEESKYKDNLWSYVYNQSASWVEKYNLLEDLIKSIFKD